ncbi:MAG: hypothetical protein IPJ78_03500 [Gemmatimonadetes bacterium]|nr:hypothetical protein [Gemmatimonadota bacterium]
MSRAFGQDASGPDDARRLLAQRDTLRAAYADSLKHLAERLRARRVPFVFAAFPAVSEMDGTNEDPNRQVMLGRHPLWASRPSTSDQRSKRRDSG